MWKYVLKRLLLLIPVMLGTILVVFFIMDQSDVDPAKVMLGDAATEETIAQLHEELGLDDPFLVRYARYVLNLIKGDMGTSYNYHTPVANQIAARLPNTILLAGTAVLLTIIVGIPIGVLAAKKQYSFFDNITDNAASDAILLELARAFYANRDSLKRSIRIAWWSGHSDARYAGSTWYCDTHWDELNKKCVASINLDLTGCKCANQIRARTACMEGESFTANLIKEFTGVDAKAYIPMIRGADQSFWGVHIPIHIMFKYEPTDETRVSPCPSGGPWWHTDQDTLDKLDVNILLRDLRINAKAVCLITNSGALPVNLIEFINKVEKCLISIQKETPDGFGMQDVLASIGNVKSACTILVECIKDNPSTDYDAFLKSVAGELVRLVYSAGSMYQQDLSSPYQPFGIIASSVKTAKNMHGTVLALCAKTEFIRACNRIKGQCDAIQKMIKCYMTMA